MFFQGYNAYANAISEQIQHVKTKWQKKYSWIYWPQQF